MRKRVIIVAVLCVLVFMMSTVFAQAQANIDDQIASADKLFHGAQFQDAIIKLTDLLTSGELSKDQEVQALKLLGAAAVGAKYLDQAKSYLKKLAELDPTIDLDADVWAPDIMRVWYEVTKGRVIPAQASGEGGAGKIETIAVMYFDNNSVVDHDKLDALSKGLASMMIYEVKKVSQLKVVERDRINFLVDELKLQQSDLVDKSTAVRIGKLVGAHTLLMGGFMKLSKNEFRIDARLVKVETGEIIKAEYIEGKPDEIMKLEKDLVVKVLANLDIKPTEIEKKEIMKGRDASFDALYHYSRGLAYEDKKEYMAAFQQYQKALKLAPGYAEAEKKMSRLEPFVSQG